MALTKEQLIGAGISEEVATQILSNVNSLFKQVLDNNYVSKESFNAVNTEKNKFKTDLDTANEKLKTLGGLQDQIDVLNTTITNLRTENANLQTKYDNQSSILEKEYLIKNALSDIVIDIDDVFPKIDAEKVTVKDGKIESGLDEQINQIKTDKPHYFKTEKPTKPSFGFSPKDSGNPPKDKDKSVVFAEQLAEQRLQEKKAMDSATDFYFKGV